ncbi:hypothetical protein ACJMK2_015386 [Sinanodonta woodiana]|uniref:Homeobox domain-containing protein n=1 Tax=Sinanodonta woodiana TaxID=1069815 RepID=A0ABD3UQ66_SINWO
MSGSNATENYIPKKTSAIVTPMPLMPTPLPASVKNSVSLKDSTLSQEHSIFQPYAPLGSLGYHEQNFPTLGMAPLRPSHGFIHQSTSNLNEGGICKESNAVHEFPYPGYHPELPGVSQFQELSNMRRRSDEHPTSQFLQQQKNKKRDDSGDTIDVANESREHLRLSDLPNNTDSSISTQASASPRSTESRSQETSPTESTSSGTSPQFVSSPSEALISPTASDVGQAKKKSRTNYSPDQVQALEKLFHENPYPESEKVEKLSKELSIPEGKLKVWFQNKRARWRRRVHDNTHHYPPIIQMSPVISPVHHYGFMAPPSMMGSTTSPPQVVPNPFFPYPGSSSPCNMTGNTILPSPTMNKTQGRNFNGSFHQPQHHTQQMVTSPTQMMPPSHMRTNQMPPYMYSYRYGTYPH